MLRVFISIVLIVALSTFGFATAATNTNMGETEPLGVISPDPRKCAPSSSESATFIRMQATDCTAQPCSWFGGLTYELGITFIPSVTTSRLALDGKFRYGADNPSFGSVSFPGTYYAGLSYTVTRTLTLPANFPLGPSILEIWLYDENSRLLQRCFDFTVSACNCPCNLFKNTGTGTEEATN